MDVNHSSISSQPGKRKWPHNWHVAFRHSDVRAPRMTGAPEMAGPDGLGPQCCTGTLEEMRPKQEGSRVQMLDER